MGKTKHYTDEPGNPEEFTEKYDKFYTSFAGIYDMAVKYLPIWKKWIGAVVPYIVGPRVLEVSFGTGYLMTRYAGRFETHGIDYNERLVEITRKNLERKKLGAVLVQGTVESMPYEDGRFDCIVNTMAFSGYPDGTRALSEMHRVLKKNGLLLMVDINYPSDMNRPGMWMTRFWEKSGDIIRDMTVLFEKFNFYFSDTEIGGFGSVHLYRAEKM